MKKTIAIYGVKDRDNYKYPGFVHDHNICIMDGGKVVDYLHLERYTRRKYDNRIDLFLEELIENKTINIEGEFDIIFVNSFEANSFISNNGKIKFESSELFPFPPKLVKSCFCRFNFGNYKFYEPNAYMLSHELAHIFTNTLFYGMFKENSLLIHFDGGASVGNFSAYHFKNNQLKFIEAHWELSHLSKFFNDNALTFAMLNAEPGEHTSVPGKLMGFAAFGKYSEKIEKFLIKNNFFKDIWNNHEFFFKEAYKEFNIIINKFDTKNKFLQDIAATFQKIFENTIIKKIKELNKIYKSDYLYYSGGSSLNIITNSKILETALFKEVYIPPVNNDSGLSLGAAAYLEWTKGNKIKKHSPYLNNIGIKQYEKYIYNENLLKDISNLLLKNKIIGISNGYAEAGARALGNRSIIALANSKNLARKVSQDCKNREWYRPIAPIILKSLANKITGKKINHLAKFMLLDFKILQSYQNKLEGVIHVNGTSRIQSIEKNDNPFIYDLLTYLFEKHNIYGLINTSFNKRGEPIVHTAKDALNSAKNMKLDAVVINYELIIL